MNQANYHLITSEYPPQPGGVSDYTRMVANELAAAGDEVHVWCPRKTDAAPPASENGNSKGVTVHRELGGFKPADLRRAGKLLDQYSAPRRLLVQWVPHGYGYRSMNLPFCFWLRRRAIRHRDIVEVMVHEPYLAFGEGSLKQNGVAAIHRLMTMVLLSSARRVWMSIPAWENGLRPYALGRSLPFNWLPVSSNIAVVDDLARVREIRAFYAPAGEMIAGHFGTRDRHTTELLLKTLPPLLRNESACKFVLVGRGGEQMCDELIRKHPDLAGRVKSTGTLDANDLSLHISACDVLVQPYIDGVSTRRTSIMIGLSHGKPIVTTKGQLSESLWAESGAVSICPVDEITTFVSEAQLLLGDKEKRLRLGAAAQALYRDRFHPRHTVEALRKVES